MAFAQSLNNQSSVLRINIMVVDDDLVFLEIMSRMLERSKYKDPSMEITVIAVRDAKEALSILKIQRNNIDLIVTDYYMPGMTGLQLKQQITQLFGNFPVIFMSSDANKEQESLACGALCFLPKPIKPTDLPKIYQVALTYKRNGKSILGTEQYKHKDTHVSIPQQIQLPPEQPNVSKTKKFSSRSDSRSLNSLNGSYDSTDGPRKNLKRKSNGDSADDVESVPQPSKKSKLSWTDDLHNLFLQAIDHIGLHKAVPKKILEYMDVSYLTRDNVASHLQKYRQFLKKVAERGSLCSTALHGRGMQPYHSNYTTSSSWYDTGLNNKSFYSKPSHGLGQSRLLSNTSEPVRFNQKPYNYMNRLSTYEPHRIGSNMTIPIQNNLSFSTQPLQSEGSRSFLEPTVMGNKTGQTPQVLGYGQHGVSAINGNNFNKTVSSYGSSTSTQPGMNILGSLTPTQPRMGNHESLTSNQPGKSSHGSLTPTQPGISSYGSVSPNQLGINSHGSLTPTQQGMSSYGSLSPSQPGMSSYGSLTPTEPRMGNHESSSPNQPGMSSNGSLTPTQPGMSSYGNLTSNQPGMGSHGSLSPNQPRIGSHGSLTPTQPGMSSNGSLTTNQPQMSSYESLTPNQQGPSNISYGLLLNNENAAYKPQPHASATIQPNLEIPQPENLGLYDDLGNIIELSCDLSNFDFDHDKKQQEEAVSTNKFESPANLETELNQIFSLEENGDWTFLNMNQGHSNEETSDTFAAPEMNDPIFNKNPNHAQEQDVPDIDWSLLDLENLAHGNDFMDSMFTNGMN